MTKQERYPTLRLTTLEQTEALRSSPSDPECLAFQQQMLDDGFVYEVPAHEWVSPTGQRGRLCWQPDHSEIWLQGPRPAMTIIRTTKSGPCCAGYELLPSRVPGSTVEAHSFDCPTLPPVGCDDAF